MGFLRDFFKSPLSGSRAEPWPINPNLSLFPKRIDNRRLSCYNEGNQITNEDIIFLNYTKDKYGEICIIKEEKEDIAQKIENTKNLGCPTKCFKKELLEGIRFPEAKRYEDINFALEAMCKAETFGYFEDSFFTYRKVPTSNTTTEITADAMIDILEELVKMYRLCTKYPKYKINILNRIKKDKLNTRLDILNHLIEFDENKFFDYFN